MNKSEFLQTLDRALSELRIEDKSDILYDYEEHFRIGIENGKTDEELIIELGDPVVIAKQYGNSALQPQAPAVGASKASPELLKKTAQVHPQNKGNSGVAAFMTACGLALFNLIFVLGPYVGIVGAIIGLFAASFGLAVGGTAMVFGPVFAPFYPNFMDVMNGFSTALMMSLGVGTAALGALLLIGMCYLTKYFYIGTVKYLKWNIKMIIG